MKYILAIVLLQVSLAACASASSFGKHNCSLEGEICIEVRADEPISFGEPVTVTITVTSEKDISNLGVHLIAEPKRIIVQEAVDEEPGKVTRKDQSWVNWIVDVVGGQPISYVRKLNLLPEAGEFWIQAQASTPNLFAADSIRIYMTREGGKAYLSGTPIPITPGPQLVDTMDPSVLATFQARPTRTPYPTMPPIPPTETPLPDIPETPAYPPPEMPLAAPNTLPYP